MLARLPLACAAALAITIGLHLTIDAQGPAVLIMEGGKHRVLLVERASKSVIAENKDFGRIECLAAVSADEFIVCEGTAFVRIDRELKERSRRQMAFEHVGHVSWAGG